MIHNKNPASSELRLSLYMEYKDNNKTGDIILADFKFYQISIELKSDSDLKIDTKSVK